MREHYFDNCVAITKDLFCLLPWVRAPHGWLLTHPLQYFEGHHIRDIRFGGISYFATPYNGMDFEGGIVSNQRMDRFDGAVRLPDPRNGAMSYQKGLDIGSSGH